MARLKYDVHVGRVGRDAAEAAWREHPERATDDDEELERTPREVVDVLGFDPLDEDEVEKFDPNQPRVPAGSAIRADGSYTDAAMHADILGEPDLLELARGRVARKSAPRTLYVKRRLANADEVREHYRRQGLASALPPEDMHATIAFSRDPVDWSLVEVLTHNLVVAGGKRSTHQFPPRSTPNGALVLKFESAGLERRWAELRDAGASWDFPEYQPHITITYSVAEANAGTIEPFRGPLVFGPEEHDEVNEDWANEIREEPL